MLLTKILTCMFFLCCYVDSFFHVAKVCIYADPCTVYEQKQRGQRVGNEMEKTKRLKNKTIKAKLMLFMDIVDDDVDDQLYPAICSILPVQ